MVLRAFKVIILKGGEEILAKEEAMEEVSLI